MASIAKINQQVLQTVSDFRIELPTGGGWSVWNNARDSTNQVFITDSQCGMVCQLYYTTDTTRDQTPTVDVHESGRYCIYAWWKDINETGASTDKSGWLTIGVDGIMRADPDETFRSGFAFSIPSDGAIPGLSSCIVSASFAGNPDGEIRYLQGVPMTMGSGNQGVSPFWERKSGVIRRMENGTYSGYWVTIY